MKFRETIIRHVKNQQYLYWIFIAIFILPNVLMFFTESTSTIARVCNVMLPLAFYLWAFTLCKKPGKMYWWLYFFSFLSSVQIVLLYLYGESPIAVDMFFNATTTNPAETTELLSNLFPAVVFALVIYIGGMVLAVFSLVNKETLSERFCFIQRRVAIVMLGAGVILLGITYMFDRKFKVQNDVFPVNGVYNLGLSIARTSKALNYDKNTAKFTYHAKSVHPDSVNEIVVMVIGETLRADNLSLYGYERSTTPQLEERSDNLAVFRDALTMSNTTYKSVPLLLTSVGCQDNHDNIYHQKGVITAFKEAGYSTAFFSCQRRNHSIIDRLGQEADDVRYLKDALPMLALLPDGALVNTLREKLAAYNGGKLFILIHCYGSHFNYHDRYDRKEAYYLPDDIPSADKKYRERMVNAYDNSVRHTDKMLAGFVDALKEKHLVASLIFTSDHGEDIFDDARQRFLHSSPIPTYYQLRVPFIVWTSSEFQRNYPEKWQSLLTNRELPISVNRTAFHTLLDLGGVTTSYFKTSEAVSNPLFKVTQRRYVTDHNEFNTLDDIGLKPLDIEQFHKNNLRFP